MNREGLEKLAKELHAWTGRTSTLPECMDEARRIRVLLAAGTEGPGLRKVLSDLVDATAGSTDAVFDPTPRFLNAHAQAVEALRALVMQAVKLCICEIITGGQRVDNPKCPFHHPTRPVEGERNGD